MSFSDDDLKRLKELLYKANSEGWTGCYMCSRFKEDSDALLARLEAAEEFAQESICHCKYDCGECGKLREVWERSRGK